MKLLLWACIICVAFAKRVSNETLRSAATGGNTHYVLVRSRADGEMSTVFIHVVRETCCAHKSGFCQNP